MGRALAYLIFLAIVVAAQLPVVWAIDWLVDRYGIREWLIAFYGF